jgi:3-methyladenine DNA glycosylase AlkD
MGMTAAERAGLVKGTLAEIAALKVRNTPALRVVRQGLSKKLKSAGAEDVKAVALGLAKAGRKWLGYEIVNKHGAALESLTVKEVEALGHGISSWDEVDTFAVLLSGAAWQLGAIGDADVKRWARSRDLWWRRAALVSTVPLNMASRGGRGDPKRTLMIAEMLVADHEDMVVKAMSWALRELAKQEPKAVQAFLVEHEDELAARVKREVRNKLKTGLKNPKGKQG